MHDPNRPLTPAEKRILARLEALIKKKLSGTTVSRDGFGHTVLKFKTKSLALMGSNYDGGGVSLSLKADKFTQEILIDTGEFVRTPYIGQHGWVSVDDEPRIKKNWAHVERLLETAWTALQPKPRKSKKK
jgi:predicted DNA-binding protein (MmcQ/YjbR family)